MRFYKDINEEKFIDFFSSAGGEDGKEKDGVNHSISSHSEEKEFISLIPENIETKKEKINIKVNRKEDIIESVDVECECGNKVRLIIDYDN